jgi:hypothetical protein
MMMIESYRKDRRLYRDLLEVVYIENLSLDPGSTRIKTGWCVLAFSQYTHIKILVVKRAVSKFSSQMQLCVYKWEFECTCTYLESSIWMVLSRISIHCAGRLLKDSGFKISDLRTKICAAIWIKFVDICMFQRYYHQKRSNYKIIIM